MYSYPDAKMQKQWTRFAAGLDALNRQQTVISLRLSLLKNNAVFCASQTTEKVCPYAWGDDAYIAKLESFGKQLDRQIAALNRAFEYTQRGLAFTRTSGDDFQIVVPDGLLTQTQTDRATYNPSQLPEQVPELGWVFPVIIAGVGAVVIIVSACLTAIEESQTKQKSLDVELKKSNNKAIIHLSKDPAMLDKYLDYQNNIEKPTQAMIDKLLGAGTGKTILSVGIMLIVGFFIFKQIQGRK